MFCLGYTLTLVEELNEHILGIVEFHEWVGLCLEYCTKIFLGIVEFHGVGKTLLEVLHEKKV